MASYCKRFFTAKSIILCLRKLLRKPRRNSGGTVLVPDERPIVVDEDQISRTAEPSPPPPPNPSVNEDSEPRLADAVEWHQPPLPPNCSRLRPGDIEILGNRPARAGSFADVWDGSLAGTRVVVKSYRVYSTVDPTHARMRLYKEALASSLLSHQNVVPFRAAYTTPEYPLALVYDFMRHRSLGEYLRDNGGIRRMRLLADIAQGLLHMHDLDIIHGNLKISNILVDANGTARIAGFGSAFVPSQNHVTWSEMDAELLFYGTAPELVRPHSLGSRIQTTKESDIYAFALLTWELFTGHVPFPDRHQLAAIHSLTNDVRPSRPDHHELSDQVWDTIQKCWHDDPSRRMLIKDVVTVLKAEISRKISA